MPPVWITFTPFRGSSGQLILIYVIAGIFVGQLGQMPSSSPAYRIARILPTYCIAEGAYNASQNLGSFSSNLLDIGVILGSTIVLFAIATWVLRRQSEVLALIWEQKTKAIPRKRRDIPLKDLFTAPLGSRCEHRAIQR
jgi:cytochrome oxidase assembly protein ShyY1